MLEYAVSYFIDTLENYLFIMLTVFFWWFMMPFSSFFYILKNLFWAIDPFLWTGGENAT